MRNIVLMPYIVFMLELQDHQLPILLSVMIFFDFLKQWIILFSDGDFNKLKKSADIGVLLFVGPESGCGQAFHIDPLINDEHIALVRKSCSVIEFTFGHEVAHLFGCEHNREEHDSSSNAHGYLMKPPVNSGFRTIMR